VQAIPGVFFVKYLLRLIKERVLCDVTKQNCREGGTPKFRFINKWWNPL